MIGLRTLVLQNNYLPISLFPLHAIPVEDAVIRLCAETCRVVYNYDRRILTPRADVEMYWPAVIVRNDPSRTKNGVKLSLESLYYRDHGKCQFCEEYITLNMATKDHVIPKSLGGKHNWENLVIACSRCNHKKGNKNPTGMWLPKKKPYKPTYYDLLNIRKNYPITIYHESWKEFLGEWKSDIILHENAIKARG